MIERVLDFYNLTRSFSESPLSFELKLGSQFKRQS